MRRLLAVALCVLLSAPLFARNNFEHMAVAWIAYQHLNPNTKLAVNELIADNPSYQNPQVSVTIVRLSEGEQHATPGSN